MICVNGIRECGGCMDCRKDETFYCPVCMEQVFEIVYLSSKGALLGCDKCVRAAYYRELKSEV